MIILGVETSCDETAISLVKAEGEASFTLLGSALFSQVALHAEHGGVVPNLAKREHAKNLVPLFEKALKEAGLLVRRENSSSLTGMGPSASLRAVGDRGKEELFSILEREEGLYEQVADFLSKYEKPNIDAIAVTEGPGLEPALWVGISFARALAHEWNLPLVPTNHMEGHIVSPLIQTAAATSESVEFPLLALLVSGGHTELVHAERWGEYKILGQTRDDAVGEAFDKVARMMGFPYPGGPEISKHAAKARKAGHKSEFSLPRPMMHTNGYEFSFSGLKTAVLYLIKKLNANGQLLTETQKESIALEFENAAIEVLVAKTKRALEEYQIKTLIIAGGVVANTALREAFQSLIKQFPETKLLIPTKELSTDNATMIAMAGYLRFAQNSKRFTPETPTLAQGNLSLEKA